MQDLKPSIFVFDIDGTLTKPTQPMDEIIARWFRDWRRNEVVYFVTGSNWEKICYQLPPDVLLESAGIFASSGSQFFRGGQEILHLRRDWTPGEELIKYFESKLAHSKYEYKAGNHLDDRIGMINFSVAGRNSTLEQRARYFEWDILTGERQAICREAEEKFPELQFHIGGQISIDCYPKGMGKGRAISTIIEWHPEARIVFIGDKLYPGGNDYPVIANMRVDDVAIQTDGPEDTIKIIKSMNISLKCKETLL